MKANARQYAEGLTVAYAAGERSTQELVTGFMNLLRKKGSVQLASKVLSHLEEMEAEKTGTLEVVIETAHAVKPATQKILMQEAEKLFSGKKIIPDFQIVPELTSGFRIRGKDKQLDQSFVTHFKKLRKELTQF